MRRAVIQTSATLNPTPVRKSSTLTSELFCVLASLVAMKYWMGVSRMMTSAPTMALTPSRQWSRKTPITICKRYGRL